MQISPLELILGSFTGKNHSTGWLNDKEWVFLGVFFALELGKFLAELRYHP
jgi:hypothetical protein